jgi:ABC-2 type transport system permease protein
MIGLVRLELLKLRTVRSSYGLLGLAAALTALDAVLRASRAGNGRIAPLDTAAGLRTVCTLTGFAMLMAMVLGATTASGEFRHGTATLTYLESPNRARVLIAKALCAALCGLALGAIGAAVATGIGLAFVAGRGYDVALAGGTIARYGIGAGLAAALLAAVGVGVGSLVRAQIAAVVGVLIWAIFVESIVGGLFNSIGPYLPFTAATTLAGASLGGGGFGFAGTSTATALPFAAAAALIAAVTLVIAFAAARTTVTADIS